MKDPIISVSGLRGIVGQGLTPLVAARYAAAFVAGLSPGPILVARDGRATGGMVADIVRGALRAMGRDVLDAGIAATPTVGVLVREHRAAGGIQISASHNPPQYNGLKLFSPEGRVINAAAGEEVLQRFHKDQPTWSDHASIGDSSPVDDTLTRHCELVLATVDPDRIRKRGFRVLLDSNRGAGSLLGRRLLSELGCEVTILGDQPDGCFEHPAEPTQENLAGVLAQVTATGADIGFCQDPDADRLAVIDESGRYTGEEYTVALCLDHVLRQNQGPVVTNCSTSRMSEDLAGKYGAPFSRSAVGEANVTDHMIQAQAVFGGEGNGGPIDPRVGYVRDSFVGMALILDAMASRELPVSQLAEELPRYEICKTKIDLGDADTAEVLNRLEAAMPDAQSNRLDGLRFDWPGRWLLVRASNTEPIIRAVAEAETMEAAQELCESAGTIIQAVH